MYERRMKWRHSTSPFNRCLLLRANFLCHVARHLQVSLKNRQGFGGKRFDVRIGALIALRLKALHVFVVILTMSDIYSLSNSAPESFESFSMIDF